MPEGTVGMVLGLVGLLLVLVGLALPEGVTSTAIHIFAIVFIAGAIVFLGREHAKRERGPLRVSKGSSRSLSPPLPPPRSPGCAGETASSGDARGFC